MLYIQGMDNSFVGFLQLLEILAFFSGYPMVFLLVKYAGQFSSIQKLSKKAMFLLPYSYGIIGLLFIGFQLRNAYPGFDWSRFQHVYLIFWGILSVLFTLSVFAKQPYLSLFHSLIFLFVLFGNIIWKGGGQQITPSEIRNYMTVYSISLALNLVIVLVAITVTFFYAKMKGQ